MSCKKKEEYGDGCCFSCCNEKKYVQDKICCEFGLTGTTPSPIYVADQADSCIMVSGTIKNCGSRLMRIQFTRRNTLVREVEVQPNSCITFTLAAFDTITARTTAGPETEPNKGEICVTPRYRLN